MTLNVAHIKYLQYIQRYFLGDMKLKEWFIQKLSFTHPQFFFLIMVNTKEDIFKNHTVVGPH